MLSLSSSFDSVFNEMQKLSDDLQKEVEKSLDTSFKTFDILEHKAIEDPEHTSYFMKVRTDDNGHIRLKTIRHKPGSKWETHVEEWDKGYRGQKSVSNEVSDKPPALTTNEA